MKIISINRYRDGGTFGIETDKDFYCLSTSGKLYKGFPQPNDSNFIGRNAELEIALIDYILTNENNSFVECFYKMYFG